jgi:hypothetical protein
LLSFHTFALLPFSQRVEEQKRAEEILAKRFSSQPSVGQILSMSSNRAKHDSRASVRDGDGDRPEDFGEDDEALLALQGEI